MINYSFIEVQGIKIAYLEKNRTADKIIFFIHGNSISKRSWRKQYNSDLFSAYHLIVIDLPGHGNSGIAENPEEVYNLIGLASIMHETVEQLSRNKPYLLAGLSLSTNIVAEMLAFSTKASGLVLAGSCIVGKNYPLQSFVKAGTHVGVVFSNDAPLSEVLLYAKETSLTTNQEDIDIFLEDYKATDKIFRGTLAVSVAAEKYSDEVELLQQSNIKSLVVFGKDEKIVEPGYLDNAPLNLWRGEVFKIEDAGHLVNIDQPEAFNQLLKVFADEIFH